MKNKHRLIHVAVVAAVMGTAGPAYAAPYQEMYHYRHYDNGVLVGEQRDLCTSSGVVAYGQYLWGRAGDEVEPSLWIGCEDGQWVPLQ